MTLLGRYQLHSGSATDVWHHHWGAINSILVLLQIHDTTGALSTPFWFCYKYMTPLGRYQLHSGSATDAWHHHWGAINSILVLLHIHNTTGALSTPFWFCYIYITPLGRYQLHSGSATNTWHHWGAINSILVLQQMHDTTTGALSTPFWFCCIYITPPGRYQLHSGSATYTWHHWGAINSILVLLHIHDTTGVLSTPFWFCYIYMTPLGCYQLHSGSATYTWHHWGAINSILVLLHLCQQVFHKHTDSSHSNSIDKIYWSCCSRPQDVTVY